MICLLWEELEIVKFYFKEIYRSYISNITKISWAKNLYDHVSVGYFFFFYKRSAPPTDFKLEIKWQSSIVLKYIEKKGKQ